MSYRSDNGNCHRTPATRDRNIAYRADTAYIGECRKCGKPFMRTFTDYEEYEAWWKTGTDGPMPTEGWSDWKGWSPTQCQYLIREQP